MRSLGSGRQCGRKNKEVGRDDIAAENGERQSANPKCRCGNTVLPRSREVAEQSDAAVLDQATTRDNQY